MHCKPDKMDSVRENPSLSNFCGASTGDCRSLGASKIGFEENKQRIGDDGDVNDIEASEKSFKIRSEKNQMLLGAHGIHVLKDSPLYPQLMDQ